MRARYHEELDEITECLVAISTLAGRAVGGATIALLDADLRAAETVITEDLGIDARYADIETRVMRVLARQQPVATDLRTIITSLRIAADLERMGDLALHIAEVARRRYPVAAIPPALDFTVRRMGQVAQDIGAKCSDIIASRNLKAASEMDSDDDAMDTLHRRLIEGLLTAPGQFGIEPAIDVTLCGRFYERFCDHAVTIARRVTYVVTGERLQYG